MQMLPIANKNYCSRFDLSATNVFEYESLAQINSDENQMNDVFELRTREKTKKIPNLFVDLELQPNNEQIF